MILLLSGIPRSGSSMLSAILRENKDITANGRSGLLPILYATSKTFDDEAAIFLSANNINKDFKKNTLSYISSQYHNNKTKYSVDKSAFWTHPNNFYLTQYFDSSDKIVVLVRDIKDVLRSWIAAYGPEIYEEKIESLIMKNENMIDLPLTSIIHAIDQGLSDKLEIIDYEDLINNTEKSVERIYEAWRLPKFKHNFDKIDDTVIENDEHYGVSLHNVRPIIGKKKNDIVLTKEAEEFCEIRNELLYSYNILTKKEDVVNGTFCSNR